MEEKINEIIDKSEIVRMAQRHFDEESVEMMIKELKEKILEAVK